MENQTGPTGSKSLVQWAITPPQSYVVYLVALFMVPEGHFTSAR